MCRKTKAIATLQGRTTGKRQLSIGQSAHTFNHSVVSSSADVCEGESSSLARASSSTGGNLSVQGQVAMPLCDGNELSRLKQDINIPWRPASWTLIDLCATHLSGSGDDMCDKQKLPRAFWRQQIRQPQQA